MREERYHQAAEVSETPERVADVLEAGRKLARYGNFPLPSTVEEVTKLATEICYALTLDVPAFAALLIEIVISVLGPRHPLHRGSSPGNSQVRERFLLSRRVQRALARKCRSQ